MRLKLGALCWMLTILYFAVQPAVAAAWDPPYSYTGNTISDLGYATCGPVDESLRQGVYVCSPRHVLMNVTFILTNLLTIAGAVLLRGWWPCRRLSTAGFALLILSGVGGVMIGLAPADLYLAPHVAGAVAQFAAVCAPLLFGLAAPPGRRSEKLISIALGMAGIIGSLMFLTGMHGPLGLGGSERLAFDPLTLWLIILGTMVLTGGRTARTHGLSSNGRRAAS